MEVELRASRYEEEKIIKDLGFSFVFSNSERNELGCPRRWYFSYSQNLRLNNIPHSFRYGIYWHNIMERLFLFWKLKDKDIFTISEDQVAYELIKKSIAEIEADAKESGIDPEPIISQLIESLTGYLQLFGRISEEFKVLEVEVPMRFPVKNWKGEQFTSVVSLEDLGDRYIIANPDTLSSKRKEVRMPFYVIGRADAIVQSRLSGEEFIYDHKTTSSVNRFMNTVEQDPQLISYAAMFEYEKTEGSLQKYKDLNIGGVVYGLANNNKTSIPKTLKDGSLSQARHLKIPTWTYEKYIQSNGLDRSLYESHLSKIAYEVNPLWHKREWFPIYSYSIERWKQESYGIARFIADKYRCLATIPSGENWVAPRIPTCKTTGCCAYKEICVEDTPLKRSMNYEVEQKLFWKKNPKWR